MPLPKGKRRTIWACAEHVQNTSTQKPLVAADVLVREEPDEEEDEEGDGEEKEGEEEEDDEGYSE